MCDNIKIKKPEELKEYISREAGLLKDYAELICQEERELVLLENLVSETEQILNYRKRGLDAAIEQTRRQKESEARQEALRGLKKKLDKYENQDQIIKQCNEDLNCIQKDYMAIRKECISNSDEAAVLSTKIEQLIQKIIDTM